MESRNKRRALVGVTVSVALVVALILTLPFPRAVKAEKPIHAHYGTETSDSLEIRPADEYDEIFLDMLKTSGYTEIELKAAQKQYKADIAAAQREQSGNYSDNLTGTGSDMATGDTAAASIAGEANGATSFSGSAERIDFSDTNNQTLGVQEADVIKSDGRYIYAINSEKLNIIEANGANPKLVASIKQHSDQGETYFNIMLTETRLVAIKEGYDPQDKAGGSFTGIDVFDITDPAKPVKLNSLTQSGSYNESRLIGDSLYLLSSYYGNQMSMDRDVPATFIPNYTEAGAECLAQPEDILMPPERTDAQYTLISGIDISDRGTFVSKKSVFGISPIIYASERNIYLASQSPAKSKDSEGPAYAVYTDYTETLFSRFALGDGMVRLAASSRVPGWVLDQFSMDEYNDVFRVVTTDERNTDIYYEAPTEVPDGIVEGWVKTNAVYTMDSDMNILGSITEIAEDEQVYSARFMDDYVYFVTFRETDPLFSADLSDPKNPKIVGALKIPGFSEYLHPYDDGLLLGVGQERSTDGSAFLGIKLSMFDISDPAQVTEQSKLVLKKYNSTPVGYNHKAILVNNAKSLVAFPADNKYVIFSYDNGRFKSEKEITVTDDMANSFDRWYDAGNVRGMFIEDHLYVVTARSVSVYDMKDGYAKIGSLTLGGANTEAANRSAYRINDVQWICGNVF
jgi:uncharacterized secreted protein with C-terminal beta-propeller domain